MWRFSEHVASAHLADGVDGRQQVGGDHEREDVHGHQHGGAYGEHDEQPLGHVGRLVDLQLHHGYHGESCNAMDIGQHKLKQLIIWIRNETDASESR